jgi:hypothetical protein
MFCDRHTCTTCPKPVGSKVDQCIECLESAHPTYAEPDHTTYSEPTTPTFAEDTGDYEPLSRIHSTYLGRPVAATTDPDADGYQVPKTVCLPTSASSKRNSVTEKHMYGDKTRSSPPTVNDETMAKFEDKWARNVTGVAPKSSGLPERRTTMIEKGTKAATNHHLDKTSTSLAGPPVRRMTMIEPNRRVAKTSWVLAQASSIDAGASEFQGFEDDEDDDDESC